MKEQNMNARIPVGLQLYSVREQCAKDLPGVLKAVKQAGYDAVEFAGYHNYTAYDLRQMRADNALQCCGTHIGMDQLEGDKLGKTINFHKILGCPYLIVPWLPKERRNTVFKIGQLARQFNELAETLAGAGMKTGYHAHADDFALVSNRSAWDILFGSTTSDVVMQMDTGNAMSGGADPVAILKAFPGRAQSIHLKEFGGPEGAIIGEGTVAWGDIFACCQAAGTTAWYVVEHEYQKVDPLQAIARCREGLRKFGV